MGVYPNRLNQGALCIKNDWTFRILLPPRARMHACAPKMPSLHRIHVKKVEFYHFWRSSFDCKANKCWLKGQQMLTGRKFEMSPLHRTLNRFHTTNTAWNSSMQHPSKAPEFTSLNMRWVTQNSEGGKNWQHCIDFDKTYTIHLDDSFVIFLVIQQELPQYKILPCTEELIELEFEKNYMRAYWNRRH